jgi:hypothetical protein
MVPKSALLTVTENPKQTESNGGDERTVHIESVSQAPLAIRQNGKLVGGDTLGVTRW